MSQRLRTFGVVVVSCGLALPAAAIWTRAEINVQRWQRLLSTHRVPPDEGVDREYRSLVGYLPERGEVGSNVLETGDDGRVRYRLQYALAPRRILVSTTPSVVIETGPESASGSLRHDARFALVAALSDEVRLFKQVAP